MSDSILQHLKNLRKVSDQLKEKTKSENVIISLKELREISMKITQFLKILEDKITEELIKDDED